MKKAIVIGCYIGGLGVMRSLREMGFHIIALSYHNMDFGYSSNYAHERSKVPHPSTEEKEFVDFLIKNSDKWRGATLFYPDDEVAVTVSKNSGDLSNYYRIAAPEWGLLRTFIEKPETYRLAEKCNVPYPKTTFTRTLDDLYKIKDEIVYPCILKPVISHEFSNRFNSKIFVVNNYDQLLSRFQLCSGSGHEVMVQEIIPGPDSNIYECSMYISSNGNVTATFLSRKLRQNPPQFGMARVAISQNMIPELREFTERMLKEANFKGIAQAEFKIDPRDNAFKLLDVNVRIFRTVWLATYCGVNFPWIQYMDLVERKQVEVTNYKKDVYWIELYQDIANTIRHHNRESLGLRDYTQPYLSKYKTFADISTDDFMPFLKQVSLWPAKYYASSKSRVALD